MVEDKYLADLGGDDRPAGVPPGKQAFAPQLERVLRQWFADDDGLDAQFFAESDGFSGALLWKIAADQRCWCLRRWPRDLSAPDRLHWIHGLLEHLANDLADCTPLPRKTSDGATWVCDDGHLWEVAPWLRGQPGRRRNFSPARLAAAAAVLARLHLSAATYPTPRVHAAGDGVSPGLEQRRTAIHNLRSGELAALRDAVEASAGGSCRGVAEKALTVLPSALQIAIGQLETCVAVELPLQWRWGDARGENFLFEGDHVTGVVDFATAGIDSVAGDLARLLGSLAGDDPGAWQVGLQAYQRIRPLSPEEQAALAAFDAGGAVAAVANWIRWVFVEGRFQANHDSVAVRLADLAKRLEAMNRRGHASVMVPWT